MLVKRACGNGLGRMRRRIRLNKGNLALLPKEITERIFGGRSTSAKEALLLGRVFGAGTSGPRPPRTGARWRFWGRKGAGLERKGGPSRLLMTIIPSCVGIED